MPRFALEVWGGSHLELLEDNPVEETSFISLCSPDVLPWTLKTLSSKIRPPFFLLMIKIQVTNLSRKMRSSKEIPEEDFFFLISGYKGFIWQHSQVIFLVRSASVKSTRLVYLCKDLWQQAPVCTPWGVQFTFKILLQASLCSFMVWVFQISRYETGLTLIPSMTAF